MMKWGRKDSHTSPTYLINYVFPISWLRKLKRKSGTWKAGAEQATHKAKGNEITRCFSMPTKFKEGRFYSGTDDLYWRLSFGEDSLEETKGRDVTSIWYNLDVPKSRCKRSRSRSPDRYKLRFHETIKKQQYTVGNGKEKYQQKEMKAKEQRLKASGGYERKDQEQRSSNRRVLKEKKSNINRRYNTKQERVIRSAKKDLYETKQVKTVKIRDELVKSRVLDYRRKWNLLCPSCSAKMLQENCTFDDLNAGDPDAYPEEESGSEIQKSEHEMFNRMISKKEHHRLFINLSRRVRIKGRKANRKINLPRKREAARTECKTTAAEFMKNEKTTKRIIQDTDTGAEGKTVFDSYAVQKCSYDPQQDFRDSMFEMIIEKGIKQPDELEELLVCYLTHNCVDYHDLIIEVFRQVWFDLNQEHFSRHTPRELNTKTYEPWIFQFYPKGHFLQVI